MVVLAAALVLHVCPQRIVVAAPSPRATTASLSLLECGRRVLGPYRAHVGVHGLSTHHQEGDGTTPLGMFAIGPTIYGLDPNPGVKLRYHRLGCGDWWDEDSTSPTYNTFQHVACGARPPFGAGSEALWQSPLAYRELAVVQYNAAPAIPGRGSAIFLHVEKGGPTNGCISIGRRQLVRVLRRLRPGAQISISA